MGKITITENAADIELIYKGVDQNFFPNWDRHPLFGNFGRALSISVNLISQAHDTCYFAVIDGDEILILVPATCDGAKINMFGKPLTLGLRSGLGKQRRKKAFTVAFNHMFAIARNCGATTIHMLGSDSDSPLSEIDNACIDHGATPNSHVHGIINLQNELPHIRSQLRESYRSLVNWGQRKIRTVYINTENPDKKEFDRYPAFHAKVAGSYHYSDDYWNIFWDEISNGRGELALGFLENGTLATGTLVVDAGETSYYASGVYERELFDKPLGHFPVFNSIARAAARGTTTYDLGEIFPKGATSEKELQIGFFKKGFTSTFRLRTVWTLNVE